MKHNTINQDLEKKVRTIYEDTGITDERCVELLVQLVAQERQQASIEARLLEAKGYCDDGHYHDYERDMVMLPSERIAELSKG